MHAGLSSMMKSLDVRLRTAWDVSHPFVQRLHDVDVDVDVQGPSVT